MGYFQSKQAFIQVHDIIKQQVTSDNMSQIKIQPWKDDTEQDASYVNKLNTLTNFSSATNLKQTKIKKKCIGEEIQCKQYKNNKESFMNSAQSTLQHFNKTNRSEYRHRITKLVFSESNNKKYKFQPEASPSRKRIGLLTSHKFLKKPNEYAHHIKDDQVVQGKKQIYYNLTQMTSPLNNILKLKCMTEDIESSKNSEIKFFNKVREQKKVANSPAFRELSVERKVYILQSGLSRFERSLHVSKKDLRKGKNIIQQICKAEKEYSREIKKCS